MCQGLLDVTYIHKMNKEFDFINLKPFGKRMIKHVIIGMIMFQRARNGSVGSRTQTQFYVCLLKHFTS